MVAPDNKFGGSTKKISEGWGDGRVRQTSESGMLSERRSTLSERNRNTKSPAGLLLSVWLVLVLRVVFFFLSSQWISVLPPAYIGLACSLSHFTHSSCMYVRALRSRLFVLSFVLLFFAMVTNSNQIDIRIFSILYVYVP